MLAGSCHCGAVQFKVSKNPEWLTECNCSICQRHGCLWLHADSSEIELAAEPDATLTYVWGQELLAFHTCKTCGCTTHWTAAEPEVSSNMAVNARLLGLEVVKALRIRQFDGADTWQYLD